MDKVLIYQDNSKIEECQRVAGQTVTHFQGIYDRFKALGLTVTVQQMENIRGRLRVKTDSKYLNRGDSRRRAVVYTTDIEAIVIEMLMEGKELPTFAGFPMKPEVLKNLVDLPDHDLSELEADYVSFEHFTGFNRQVYMPELCTIVGDTVQLVADAETRITERWSYYAVTPRQIEVAGHLIAARDSFNEFYGYMISANLVSLSGSGLPAITGLKVINYKYHVDEHYVNRLT